MSTNQITSKIESLLEWEKIQSALEEILNLSQPKPSPDLIRKFVRKIVPDGKNNFRWYLNLDGSNSTVQDIIVEGRKTKPQSP